ncbi:hypothetical protein ACUSIJ_24705 [Pseudochelatococcus sp. B33]
MSKDNGGPAFPLVKQKIGYHADVVKADEGISVRDYFAAKALQALVTADAPSGFGTFEELLLHYATTSYQYADAMLKERTRHDREDT